MWTQLGNRSEFYDQAEIFYERKLHQRRNFGMGYTRNSLDDDWCDQGTNTHDDYPYMQV